jgi:hypothetical protein
MRLRQSDRVKTSIVSPPHGDKMARTLGRRGANTLTAPQACCPRVSRYGAPDRLPEGGVCKTSKPVDLHR